MVTATRVGVYAISPNPAAHRICARCGRTISASPRVGTPGCRDCRQSDPKFFRTINAKGQTT